ncbi:hypothetical protein ANAPC5_01404 [Anaplasma phagocytophilum]|nr:hypothetical protein ANAPC5_01404 [Anaplasma phagocytophilum]
MNQDSKPKSPARLEEGTYYNTVFFKIDGKKAAKRGDCNFVFSWYYASLDSVYKDVPEV